MEGKLSLEFRRLQEKWLDKHHPYLTEDSWMKGFMTKLLEMTHAQWIFCCITKHHKTKGTKVLAVQEDLMTEIERLLDTGAEGVAQEDRWMIEIDQEQIMSFTLEDKQFWINAVNAAMKACANVLEKSNGASNSWSELVQDDKL